LGDFPVYVLIAKEKGGIGVGDLALPGSRGEYIIKKQPLSHILLWENSLMFFPGTIKTKPR
jgi:hypothetical protein